MGGAERLLGKGDMLYFPAGAPKAIRAQGAWIQERDIAKMVEFWSRQADPEAKEENIIATQESADNEVVVDDELFDDAVQLILDSGQASISMLQRRFRIGYSRAARLIDTMELKGIVGPHQGSKAREVLIEQYESAAGILGQSD
jgi:S-DNA-T family DNA segregation ATPase FtsK/SpoIIIE